MLKVIIITHKKCMLLMVSFACSGFYNIYANSNLDISIGTLRVYTSQSQVTGMKLNHYGFIILN